MAQAEGEANALRARAQGEADALLIRTLADARNREMMATAEAHANAAISASLTPEVIEFRRIQRWNGVTPLVQGSSGTMLQLARQ